MVKRVLVVDDTSTMRSLVKLLMASTQFEFVEAADGVEALQKAVTHKLDLIFLDINMPVKDGVATLKSLKEDVRTVDIPVVMLTTHGNEDTIAKCRALGCADFLSKPIDRTKLLATVKSVLKL